MQPLTWILAAIAAIALYELLRFLALRKLRLRLQQGAIRFVRRHRIKLESARFIDRVWIRQRLMQDERLDGFIHEQARERDEHPAVLRAQVDSYVDEIAPVFSLATYYRLGGFLAKMAVNFCFELVIDRSDFDRQAEKAPEGAVRVYVMNHRSNADSLVLSYGLIRQVALSYAVGEWALVWPLDSLFRAFGSYFVRRGEKDPLYHRVLERFVQILAGQGGVTGFFIEGGLSRDGALRPPKAGLLDYLIGLRREFPDREIVFMPVGLNYDRVFEDRNLVAERDGRRPKPGLGERIGNLGRIAARLPVLIAANAVRVATRSHRKFGYAAVAFGEPLKLSDWEGGWSLHEVEDVGERRTRVKALAEHLLVERVGSAIPATPVPILCSVLLDGGGLDKRSVEVRVDALLKRLREGGAPIAMGTAFASIGQRRTEVEGVPGLDAQILDLEQAEQLTLLASHVLQRRKLVRFDSGGFVVGDGAGPLLEYYANSIVHHLPSSG